MIPVTAELHGPSGCAPLGAAARSAFVTTMQALCPRECIVVILSVDCTTETFGAPASSSSSPAPSTLPPPLDAAVPTGDAQLAPQTETLPGPPAHHHHLRRALLQTSSSTYSRYIIRFIYQSVPQSTVDQLLAELTSASLPDLTGELVDSGTAGLELITVVSLDPLEPVPEARYFGEDEQQRRGLAGGAVAGITVGAILAATLAGLLLWMLAVGRRRRSEEGVRQPHQWSSGGASVGQLSAFGGAAKQQGAGGSVSPNWQSEPYNISNPLYVNNSITTGGGGAAAAYSTLGGTPLGRRRMGAWDPQSLAPAPSARSATVLPGTANLFYTGMAPGTSLYSAADLSGGRGTLAPIPAMSAYQSRLAEAVWLQQPQLQSPARTPLRTSYASGGSASGFGLAAAVPPSPQRFVVAPASLTASPMRGAQQPAAMCSEVELLRSEVAETRRQAQQLATVVSALQTEVIGSRLNSPNPAAPVATVVTTAPGQQNTVRYSSPGGAGNQQQWAAPSQQQQPQARATAARPAVHSTFMPARSTVALNYGQQQRQRHSYPGEM